jgi:chitinase
MSEEFCAKGKDTGKEAQKSNEADDKSSESDGDDDEDSGCQSNCDQPTSGASDGDIQSRVIGYYQAFAHDRKCQNMDFDNIPVGALTHLFFSFGYITPNDFKVAPMDKLKASLFSDLTAVKTKNPDLKAVIALGGWTFNDNNTATQRVFSDLVSTADNRQEFISNLLSFMRQYAFDGVDFDWEYPGAIDRGGRPEDGKNFILLLKELQDAIKLQPIDYTISFTVPTSYWYLRLFDLKAVDHVDWINVMSYGESLILNMRASNFH